MFLAANRSDTSSIIPNQSPPAITCNHHNRTCKPVWREGGGFRNPRGELYDESFGIGNRDFCDRFQMRTKAPWTGGQRGRGSPPPEAVSVCAGSPGTSPAKEINAKKSWHMVYTARVWSGGQEVFFYQNIILQYLWDKAAVPRGVQCNVWLREIWILPRKTVLLVWFAWCGSAMLGMWLR